MGPYESVALGVTQGVTEFLPISSDGHLALVYGAMGQRPNLSFEILLHAATLVAMLTYFRRDVADVLRALLPSQRARVRERRLAGLIVLATAISGAVAVAIAPVVEPMSASLPWLGVWFLFTAAALTLAEWFEDHVAGIGDAGDLAWWKVSLIGLAQGAAVLPGVSRSGTTIAAGMMSGLDRERSARFSFLLGIPIITLAVIKDVVDVVGGASALPPFGVSLIGFVAAGLAGYGAIWGLLALVKRHSLYWFAAYTAALGTGILVWTAMT